MHPIPLASEVLDLIEKKFQLVDIINLVFYDLKLSALENKIKTYKDFSFAVNQKIIILHHDTDYYIEQQGNTTYNVVKLLVQYQISLDHVIVVTNHYGLEKEIKSVLDFFGQNKQPGVLYTSLWYDYPNVEDLGMPMQGQCNKLFACLNGQERSHRVATLCFLEHFDLKAHGLISYHFNHES